MITFISYSVSPVFAAPWWWTQFTVGDDSFNNSSNFEKWMALYPYSAQPDEDVWLASYTWGTGNNGPVNGFYGDNEFGGINQVYLRRQSITGAQPVRVLGDGDATDILDLKTPGLPVELSPADASLSFDGTSHHKAVLLGDRSLMVGSANITAGAFSSQPNNMTIFKNFPELNRAFRREFQEQFSGTHFDNSASEKNHLVSPAGDRVSVYFAPDDNFNISLPGGESGLKISDVLEKRTAEAEESVFYMFNNMYLPDLAYSLKDASPNKLVEGVVDNGGSSFVSDLRSSHTARDANSFFSREMHHKVMIFDQEIVAFGSANHTRTAMYRTLGNRNEENMIEVHDFRLARRYMQEYRRVMSLLAEENEGQPDSFETAAPASPANFVVDDEPGRSNSLLLNWSAPADPGDFSRYYVFVADYELNSVEQIGDGIDNDGDGMIDEDPVGDADGFVSGSSLSDLNANDDDADGKLDEDPWMYPEKQLKTSSPGSVTSATLTTYNVGDQLPNNKDLWLALVAVDKHGNESDPVFYGPIQSHADEAAIQPSVDELKFASGFSQEVSDTSALELTVKNSSSASEKITGITVNFGSGDSSFITRQPDEEPLDFNVSVTSNSITLKANSGKGVAPGSAKTFTLYVKNPSVSGTSAEILVDFEDESDKKITDISAGALEILPAPSQEGNLNSIRSLTASAGPETISLFDGSEKLGSPPYEIKVELEKDIDTEVVLYWDVENSPDGPAGSSTDEKISFAGTNRIFTAEIGDTVEINHGELLEFLIYVDGEKFNYSGTPYSFGIDREVSTPSLTGVQQRGSGSVELGFGSISDPDFQEYRVYYNAGNSVDKNSDWQVFSERDISSVTVKNLDPAVTYTFAASALDERGNISSLSSPVQAATMEGAQIQEIKLFNQDRSRIAAVFDGTEKFQIEPLTVQVNFSSSPVTPVKIFYDVGDNPDGPGGFNTADRSVTANGSDTLWEAGIPGDDPEFVIGSTLKFIVAAGDQILDNGGQPFKIKFSESPPLVKNLNVADTGGGTVKLSWESQTTYPMFGEYRIYYSSSGDTPDLQSSSWKPSDDPPLTLNQTGKTVVDGLSAGVLYKFRITIIDEFGQPGPLSAVVEAAPGAKGALLLTELSPHTAPTWTEVTARVSGVNLQDYYITDLDGNIAPLALESTSLEKDKKAILWFESGTGESDFSGDKNSNGAVDLFLPSASVFVFSDTVDQIALVNQMGETVDAVVFRPNPSDDFGAEQGDVDSLVNAAHWDVSDSKGALNTYTIAELSRPAYLIRTNLYGELLDNNSKKDWEITGQGTPGSANRGLNLLDLKIEDIPSRPYQYKSALASSLDGTEKLKKTDTYRLTAYFDASPVSDSGFYLWYDTAVIPAGFADSSGDSVHLTGSYNSSQKKFEAVFSLPGPLDQEEVKTAISSIPSPNWPGSLDEKLFSNRNRAFKFQIDDRGLNSPSALSFDEAMRDGIMVSWTPLKSAEDFSTYRIYYDTAVVDSGSKYFDRGDLGELADYRTSKVILPLPVSSDTWNLRVASSDIIGNGNELINITAGVDELSDTLSVLRLAPIQINDLIFSPKGTVLADSRYLTAQPVKIQVVFDRQTSSPVLVWDKNDPTLPDSGTVGDTAVAMTKITGSEYKTTIPAGSHNDEIQFVFYTDGGRLTNSGRGYVYRVDDEATPAADNFSSDTIQYTSYQNLNTNLLVRWNPLPAGVEDFSHYRIAYQKGETVSIQSPSMGPEKEELLSERKISSAVVSGLDRAETYTLGVYWIDRVGNVSLLSDSSTIQTVDAQPTEDPAFDGKFVAHALDGTEYLRKADIHVTFLFGEVPAYPEDINLVYNIGGDPLGADGVKIPMAPVGDRIYEATIPESELMTEGVSVNYLIKQGPWYIYNNGDNFSFIIDEFPPPKLTNFNISEEGDWLKLIWSPLNSGSDFQQYKIRYRRPDESTWNIIDKSDYSELGGYRTSSVYINDLAASSNYYVNITAVDKMGRQQYPDGDILLLRDPGGEEPEFINNGEYLFTLKPGETSTLKVNLKDVFDSPWYGVEVNFEIIESGLTFTENSDTQLMVTTDSDGIASAVLQASGSESKYVPVEVTFENEFFNKKTGYFIRVLNSEEAARDPRMVPFE